MKNNKALLREIATKNSQAMEEVRKGISCLKELRKRIQIDLVEKTFVSLNLAEKLLHESIKLSEQKKEVKNGK